MKTILRIGLLMALVIVVTAHFDQIYDLPNYDTNENNEPLKYEPLNLAAKVTFKRLWTPQDKGLYFLVDAVQSDRNIASTSSRGVRSSGSSSNKSLAKECSGRPGIMATLKKSSSFNLKKKNPKVFCFNGINIDIAEKQDMEPYMRFIVDFYNSEKRQTIRIIMHPLKEPRRADNGNQIMLRIASPIPPQELSRLSKESGQNEVQSFTGDILWMNDVLKQAKDTGISKTNKDMNSYSEWYYSGPVIIARESFNNILRLDDKFEKYI